MLDLMENQRANTPCFMKGARRLLPITKTMSPSWDLAVVLGALSSHPFEPLDNVDMKTLSLKVALLLALATAKRVSEIHALSVHPARMRFTAGNLGVNVVVWHGQRRLHGGGSGDEVLGLVPGRESDCTQVFQFN